MMHATVPFAAFRSYTRRFFVMLVVLFASFSTLHAQTKSNTLPPFKMLQTNGTFYTAADVPKDKPLVLIYFAPDCEHCQQLLSVFFKKISAFKNTEVVLVSFKPVSELQLFERTYQTAKYPNLKVGTEGTTFFLRYFYKIETTPFTALFDKHQNLVYSYRKDASVDDLIKRVNGLR